MAESTTRLEMQVSESNEDIVRTSEALPPTDRGKEAYLVLLGCSILQLPIWSFATSYGILQDYYSHQLNLGSATGVVGTTMNAVIYCSMPVLSAIFLNRLTRWRRFATIAGLVLSSASLFLSSLSTTVWQLIITQGILSAFGCSLTYSLSTLYLNEWFLRRKGFAYGTVLSSKGFVGAAIPFVFSALLSRLGFQNALRIWAGIVLASGLPAIWLIRPRGTASAASAPRHRRRISWQFLHHRTFWIFQIANVVFSSGYGLPQTYLPTFGTKVVHLSSSTSSLMLALFSAPSVVASVSFGLLCDGLSIYRGHSMSVFSVTYMSALGSALPVFLLWGLTSKGEIAMLSLFSIIYGFFAGGYSATWGGVIKEMEQEAQDNDEAIDTGVVYGLMNGGRGIGYLIGGFAGVELLKAGAVREVSKWGYGSQYGSIILFTGVSAAFGGWGVLWSVGKTLFT